MQLVNLIWCHFGQECSSNLLYSASKSAKCCLKSVSGSWDLMISEWVLFDLASIKGVLSTDLFVIWQNTYKCSYRTLLRNLVRASHMMTSRINKWSLSLNCDQHLTQQRTAPAALPAAPSASTSSVKTTLLLNPAAVRTLRCLSRTSS